MAHERGTGVRSRGARLLILAAAALLPWSAAAAEPLEVQTPSQAVAIDPARLQGLADFVDGVMAEQIVAREVAGAVVTVVHDGRVLFTRGYGFANVEARRPVDPERTLFRPGSVSKTFTWTALMQQVERGRVDLDADVNSYLDFEIPALDRKSVV